MTQYREGSNVSADSAFFVAPGEGQRPIPILTDEGFEVMCNPPSIPLASLVSWLTERRNLLSINTSTNGFWMLMAVQGCRILTDSSICSGEQVSS